MVRECKKISPKESATKCESNVPGLGVPLVVGWTRRVETLKLASLVEACLLWTAVNPQLRTLINVYNTH